MRRVLLDENLPRQLKRELTGCEVRTVAELGWAGIKNGKLLRLAESEFDLFVTADQNLPTVFGGYRLAEPLGPYSCIS